MDGRITIRLGHSPDPDDAFMWWPLLELGGPARIASPRFRFEAVAVDIEALNRRAVAGDDLLEVSAFSAATYARIADRYAITACGSSVGDGYGPKLVARSARSAESPRDSNRPAVCAKASPASCSRPSSQSSQ